MSNFGSNVLITGANRGIGLALVKYLAQEAEIKRIFAACRNPDQAKDLHELAKSRPGKIHPIQLDVQDDSSIQGAYDQVKEVLKDEGLNLLINNAGVADFDGGSGYNDIKRDIYHKTLDINVVGAVTVTKVFYPLLLKSAQKKERTLVVNISSGIGSIARNKEPFYLAIRENGEKDDRHNIIYGMSKAALNYYTHAFGNVEAKNGIIAVAVAPGWIQTDMGGPNAVGTLDENIPEIIKTLKRLKLEDSGRFIDRFGETIEF